MLFDMVHLLCMAFSISGVSNTRNGLFSVSLFNWNVDFLISALHSGI